MDFNRLLSPIQLGQVTLPNRIVFPPMGTRLAHHDGNVSRDMLAYYSERARGGAGLVTVQAAYVSRGRGERSLAISTDDHVEGLAELCAAISQYGAVPGIQLVYPGSNTPGGGRAPSDFSAAELEEVVHSFVVAVQRAVRAGFSVIQIHAAHGHLLAEFLSPRLNRRTDAYGGDIRARLAFPMEVIQAAKRALDSWCALSVRISVSEFAIGGLDIGDSVVIGRRLGEADVHLVDLSAGGKPDRYEWVVQPMAIKHGFLAKYSGIVRRNTRASVGVAGRINSVELAEEMLRLGVADVISMGRALIADPFLPQKAANGQSRHIRRCTACNYCHHRIDRSEAIRCSVNAEVGHEVLGGLQPAARPRRVVIVGGGVAGMEAARVAAVRGHSVTLIERCDQLGGDVRVAMVPPHKTELNNLLEFLIGEMQRLGVELRLGIEATPVYVQELTPDEVIVAIGASPRRPEADRLSTGHFVMAREVLVDAAVELVEPVLVVGGGQTGVETAEYLASRGRAVVLIGRNQRIAPNYEPYTRKMLLQRLSRLGVLLFPGYEFVELDESSATILHVQSGELVQLSTGTVVLATGSEPTRQFANALSELLLGVRVQVVGDTDSPGEIQNAIASAYAAAVEV